MSLGPKTPQLWWRDLLLNGFEKDQINWDWTSRTIFRKSNPQVSADLLAKQSGVFAAAGLIQSLQSLAFEWGSSLKIKSSFQDAQNFKKGDQLARFTGPASLVLEVERVFINLAAYSCGIVSKTNDFVRQLDIKKWKKRPRITATRKVLPAYQDLALNAVICGGGYCHRSALNTGVLIKENHIAASGSLAEAIRRAKDAPHLLKIEVEVTSVAEVKDVLEAGADAIMLDNFRPMQIERALKKIRKQRADMIVEVSGGINEKNFRDYFIEGIDIISIGSLTHSVQSIDLSLLIKA